jgi:cleavage and polyadenylation specificity factor subunit 2
MLRVTPLYGSRYDNRIASQESSCTLIEFGGVRILWNVGLRTDLALVDAMNDNHNHLLPLGLELPEHDVLLISDSTLASCGGLPLYYRQQQQASSSSPFGVKAYATFPTVKMGQMTMYDVHARISLDGGQPPFTLEELDASFALLQTIKYAQIINITSTTTLPSTSSSPLLRITAHRAGHVIGGAFFCLQRVMDDTVVVLTTPRYHMAKELHLDSSTLLKYASTPDVLVCTPGGPAFSLLQHVYNHVQQQQQKSKSTSTTTTTTSNNNNNNKSKKALSSSNTSPSPSTSSSTTSSMSISAAMPLVTQAQRSLTELVMAVVRREGNVLLPVDASGRVWELLLLLHSHWERHRLSGAYHLIWIGPMVWNTWELGSSQLEWMASALGSQFDSQRGHPLTLQHVHKFTSVVEMEQWLQKQPSSRNQIPMCVLASGADLEGGPARDLLLQWADNPDHAVIFTDSAQCVLRPTAVVAAGAGAGAGAARRASHLLPVSRTMSVPSASDILGDALDVSLVTAPTVTITGTGATATVVPTSLSTSAITTTTPATTAAAAGEEDEEGADGGTWIGAAVTRTSPYCTAAQLLVKWCEAQVEGREMDDCVEVDVPVPRRTPLAGPELKAFLEKEEALRLEAKRLEEQRAMLREVELAKGQLRLGEVAAAAAAASSSTATTTSTSMTGTGGGGDESGTTASGATLTNAGTDGADAHPTTTAAGLRPKKKTKFDSTLFLKFSKPLHRKYYSRSIQSKTLVNSNAHGPPCSRSHGLFVYNKQVTFEVREEAVGVGQSDSVAKYGIGESIGRSGEVLEDDYGIAVIPERFVDIVTGIDPGKLTGRIGDDRNRGFGLPSAPESNSKSKFSSDVSFAQEQLHSQFRCTHI